MTTTYPSIVDYEIYDIATDAVLTIGRGPLADAQANVRPGVSWRLLASSAVDTTPPIVPPGTLYRVVPVAGGAALHSGLTTLDAARALCPDEHTIEVY